MSSKTHDRDVRAELDDLRREVEDLRRLVECQQAESAERDVELRDVVRAWRSALDRRTAIGQATVALGRRMETPPEEDIPMTDLLARLERRVDGSGGGPTASSGRTPRRSA